MLPVEQGGIQQEELHINSPLSIFSFPINMLFDGVSCV